MLWNGDEQAGRWTGRSLRLLALAALLALGGCAGLSAPPVRAGQTEVETLAALGQPTGRYALDEGVQRLEFARGPYGRTTWMVDVDGTGRVLRVEQVLTPQRFNQVRNGMSRDELLRLLGRPAHRQREWQNRETWSWRYETYDCLWLRVTLTAQGRVLGGASYLPDPRCDADD